MLTCIFCNRDEKSRNSKAQHEPYCRSNPNPKTKKPSFGMLGKTIIGRRPNTNPMTEEGKEVIRESNKNRIWTTASLTKLSISMKRAVENNPEAYSSSNRGRVKQIIYNDIKFQGNWELDFYKWCISHNIECVRNSTGFEYVWNGIRTYFPDFYLPKKEVYVEVKGYKTDRDAAKWTQFPNKLIIIEKKDIIAINRNVYTLSGL